VNGVFSLVLNTLVIFVLVTTKQLKSSGMRLVLFLSASDLLGACVCIVFLTMLLSTFSNTCYMFLETISLFFLVFCGHTSAYTIALISFDRYARVKFASNYKVKMTSRRVVYMVIGAVTLSFVDGMLFTFGNIFDFSGVVNRIVLFIDTVVIICIIASYVKFNRSILQVRSKVISTTAAASSRTRGGQSFNTSEKSLTSLIKKMLLAMAVMYALYFVAITTNTVFYQSSNDYWKSWLEFVAFFGIYMVHTNAVVNALVFLWTNKKAKSLVKRKIGRIEPAEFDTEFSIRQVKTCESTVT